MSTTHLTREELIAEVVRLEDELREAWEACDLTAKGVLVGSFIRRRDGEWPKKVAALEARVAELERALRFSIRVDGPDDRVRQGLALLMQQILRDYAEGKIGPGKFAYKHDLGWIFEDAQKGD